MLSSGSNDAKFEQYAYNEKIKVVRNMIIKECQLGRGKRDVVDQVENIKLDALKSLFDKLSRILSECRMKKVSEAGTTSSQNQRTVKTTEPTSKVNPIDTTSNKNPIKVTTTEIDTTSSLFTLSTKSPNVAECQSAVNLTGPWRKDNQGKKLNAGNSKSGCDTLTMIKTNRPWFRLTGAAGNMILDTCPPDYSCGTLAGLWTDDVMPSAVGVKKNISVYASWQNNCRQYIRTAAVIRCSAQIPNDFVYQYTDLSTACYLSFCGMTKNQ